MAKKRAAAKPRVRNAMRIFISHSHRDREAVDAIADTLRSDGHEIWIDSLQLKPGDNISQRIQEGLEQADAIVFVISRNSLHSEWVQREFSAIALQQISKRQQRIIPVRLDECEVPSYLADRLYIDFASDFAQGLKSLSAAFMVESPEALETAHPRASIVIPMRRISRGYENA